ncbi:hypothetical protein J2X04_000466 [Lysobacter niabensis]|uniref:Uncharacterized protein n=1 Tax=Agrilutibacter niabensis TaxID=380628 RepID=A0ABU1VKY0_9GAMM|nr:hypothetical protein [Lysobacter niabensis]MDR7098119.1 hypothetical protein [Lysobacter niabensis]
MKDDSYSLLRGGPAYRLTRAAGLHRRGVPTAAVIAMGLLLIVLAPMIAATAVDGTLFGNRVRIPLLLDYTIGARFLIAMPLLVLAAPAADARLWLVVKHFRKLIPHEEQERFEAVLDRVRHWRDATLPELLLFALAIAGALLTAPVLDVHEGISNWRSTTAGLSTAGLWQMWVAIPVVRFIGLLWLWRLVLWTYLLARLTRIPLDLHAAHPDGCGGLGFLGYAQQAFAPLALFGSVLLAGSFADQLLYFGQTLPGLKYLMGGYVVFAVVLLTSPLLLLTPRLLRLKHGSLLAYSVLGTDCTENFEKKWLGRAPGGGAPILEAGDPSALADLTAVHATASRMSVVPFSRDTPIAFAIAAAAPMLPVVLITMSIDDFLGKLFSIIA